MASKLDIHTHTCNHYNFFCFFLSNLSLSPTKDYRAASNVCSLWWECLFIEASVVESKGTPMQRQAKPVWIYLYGAWPTSAVRANTWLHPYVRLRGWGGGGLCIRQGGQRVREMLRMWRQGYMTVCLARSHRNITSLPLRNPGWDKSVQSVGLWVLFISVTAVKEASYKCIHICTYPQRYPPKPTRVTK